LLRLDRLHTAVASFEKDAFTSGFVLKGETATIRSKARVLLNEVEFGKFEKSRHPSDFLVG